MKPLEVTVIMGESSSFLSWTKPWWIFVPLLDTATLPLCPKVHEIWSTGQEGYHYTFNRTKDVELKQSGERREGRFVLANKYNYKDRRFVKSFWQILRYGSDLAWSCLAGGKQLLFGWRDAPPRPWQWCSLDVVCPRDGQTLPDDCACWICHTGLARWNCRSFCSSHSILFHLIPWFGYVKTLIFAPIWCP